MTLTISVISSVKRMYKEKYIKERKFKIRLDYG